MGRKTIRNWQRANEDLLANLTVQAYNLAMCVLQSDMYHMDLDAKEAVDNILIQTRLLGYPHG